MIRYHLMKQAQGKGVGKQLLKRAKRCTDSLRDHLATAFKWYREARPHYVQLHEDPHCGHAFLATHVPGRAEAALTWVANEWLSQHVLPGTDKLDSAVDAAMQSLLGAGAPRQRSCKWPVSPSLRMLLVLPANPLAYMRRKLPHLACRRPARPAARRDASARPRALAARSARGRDRTPPPPRLPRPLA